MLNVIAAIIEAVMWILLGFVAGMLFLYWAIYKYWPDLYAELRKRVFEEDDER